MKQEIEMCSRFGQGAKIALYGRIIKVKDKQEWRVFSMTKPGKQYVVKEDGSCNCPDFQFRGITCKHAYGVELKYSVLREVRA
jgi:predicted nucleic acid-binding Zn finger protein